MARKASASSALAGVKLRLAERLSSTSAIDNVPQWLTQHTSLAGKPFSFKDHEFQIDIARCTAPSAVIKKPSQVGLTELQVRIALALCGIKRHFSLIYVFPSAKMASKITKTRIDPIIEGSPTLSGMLVKGADGAELKRLGSSFLYIQGASHVGQAISVPAQMLMMDEYDFCDPDTVTAYYSRMRHASEPMDRKFSTPTVSDYGVDKELQATDMRRYMVRCEHCSKWVAPDFRKDVRIPGFDNDFLMFLPSFVAEYDVSAAWLACSECGKDLWASLCDPSRRQWVKQRYQAQLPPGFEVKPYDLPLYNTIPRLVADKAKYASEEDYWNFVQGETFDTDETQVNAEVAARSFVLAASSEAKAQSGLCMGVDVGKHRCHVVIGKRFASGEHSSPPAPRVQVLHAQELRISDGPFNEQIAQLYLEWNCVRGVIDIGPDYTLSRSMHARFGDAFLMGVYVPDVEKDPGYAKVDDVKGTINLQRTKSFNLMVKEMNAGHWQWVRSSLQPMIQEHLRGMKRISKKAEEASGDKKAAWVKTGDDHFLHAAMYLRSALSLLEGEFMTGVEIPYVADMPVMPVGVTLGSRASGASATHHPPAHAAEVGAAFRLV